MAADLHALDALQDLGPLRRGASRRIAIPRGRAVYCMDCDQISDGDPCASCGSKSTVPASTFIPTLEPRRAES